MGLGIALTDYNRKILEIVGDPKNFLSYFQIKRFLYEEWDQLEKRAKLPEEKALIAVFSGLLAIKRLQASTSFSCTSTPARRSNDAITGSLNREASNSIRTVLSFSLKVIRRMPYTSRILSIARISASVGVAP